jgi:DNA-binding transcriptional regulator YiaG
MGFSQKEAAHRIGVGPSTLAKWERAEREPAGAFLGRVKRFLQDWEAAGARRAG